MNAKLKFLAPVLAACALTLAGCASNPALTVAGVRAVVSTGAMFGLEQDPTIGPYLSVATPVICNAAGSGTVDPAAIVAALQSANIDQLNSPLGKAIINSSLAVYEAAISVYGTNIQASAAEPYLMGVCLGLRDALPPAPSIARNAPRMVLPPHLR